MCDYGGSRGNRWRLGCDERELDPLRGSTVQMRGFGHRTIDLRVSRCPTAGCRRCGGSPGLHFSSRALTNARGWQRSVAALDKGNLMTVTNQGVFETGTDAFNAHNLDRFAEVLADEPDPRSGANARTAWSPRGRETRAISPVGWSPRDPRGRAELHREDPGSGRPGEQATSLRILFLVTAHNGLSQRAWIELSELGHEVAVAVVDSAAAMQAAVRDHDPQLIVCRFLRTAILKSIWANHRCLIVHPGPWGTVGPRRSIGRSSLACASGG
jgi:hypothetical protein